MKRELLAALTFFFTVCAPAHAVQYVGGVYRDPFTRVTQETQEEAEARRQLEGIESLTLDGIAYGPKGSQAILSGQMVEVGEQVNGAKVLKITKNSVTIQYQGKEIVLKEKGNLS